MSYILLRNSFRSEIFRTIERGLYSSTKPNYCIPKNYATGQMTKDKQPKKFTPEDELDVLNRLKTTFEKEETNGEVIPIFKKALLHGNKIAIKDQTSEYSYQRLFQSSKKLSLQISNICGSASSNRVAFLCPNDIIYPLAQWACWISGQVAVPLSTRHPEELLKYFIKDSKAEIFITTPEYESKMRTIAESMGKVLIVIDHSFLQETDSQISHLNPKAGNVLLANDRIMIEGALNNEFYTKSDAMILYTSGTTGSPKGVVLTHKNLQSQVNTLLDAWQFNQKDCLLHVLPLTHVHGCVNALMCPLSVGAKVIMYEKYDSHNVWSNLLGINTPAKDRVNMFMAVPTIYNLLIDEYDKIFAKNNRMVEYIVNHCKKHIRLMVSGSAGLPVTVFNRWYEISGHKLLERYGMTEIGMALSNPYVEDKGRSRRPGTVGLPLPNVEVRIVDNDNIPLIVVKGEHNKGIWSATDLPLYQSEQQLNDDGDVKPITGELQVKGPSVFKQYDNRPDETTKEFVDDYFKTGDVAAYEDGVFRILGRSSVDIIKTGGFKVSALEIEAILLTHPNIKDAAVVGIDDITWGQKIAAVCVLRPNTELDIESLKVFVSEKLAPYQVPSVLKIVNEFPRNPMGKINKKDIARAFFTETVIVEEPSESEKSEKLIQSEKKNSTEKLTGDSDKPKE